MLSQPAAGPPPRSAIARAVAPQPWPPLSVRPPPPPSTGQLMRPASSSCTRSSRTGWAARTGCCSGRRRRGAQHCPAHSSRALTQRCEHARSLLGGGHHGSGAAPAHSRLHAEAPSREAAPGPWPPSPPQRRCCRQRASAAPAVRMAAPVWRQSGRRASRTSSHPPPHQLAEVLPWVRESPPHRAAHTATPRAPSSIDVPAQAAAARPGGCC
mmetsp:Transcript_137075/g.292768  ORF Transcript_137075/g.292768 Transcript_137075/m.292768 type:complete len:212 (+) Transcript_137075:197-832(+)